MNWLALIVSLIALGIAANTYRGHNKLAKRQDDTETQNAVHSRWITLIRDDVRDLRRTTVSRWNPFKDTPQ